MKEKQFEFEFGGNIKLKKYISSWKKREKFKGFVIVGNSGSGKTSLLNALCMELKNAFLIDGNQLLEEMHKTIIKG